MSKSSKLQLTLLVVLSASVGTAVTSRVDGAIDASGPITEEGLSDSEKQVFEGFAARLESYREQLNIPGMSAGVIRDGRLVWAKGFGYADVENKIEATPNTVYHLASLTKTFASQIIMRLVQEGKIGLDETVSKYGVRIRGDSGIRVRHLLTHTSEGTPGSRYNYNGGRFGLLGKVIERSSGRSFRSLVVSEILEPAQMKSTAPALPRSRLRNIEEDRADDAEERFKLVNRELAKPYALDESFGIVRGEYPDPAHFGVSTGLISNVLDMAKYDRAIDRSAFISREMQELAFTAALSNRRERLPYGLGWFVQTFAGVRLLWHYGWERNYSALIVKVPEERVTLVAFANSDYLSRPFELGRGDVLNSAVAVEFLKTVAFRDRFAEPPPEIDWQADAGDIAPLLKRVKDPNLVELLRRELIANLMLNHRMARGENTSRLMEVYKQAFTRDEFDKFGGMPVIASIDDVSDSEYRTVEFALEEATAVAVYAIGEGEDGLMCDYGGIEDARTGRLVWEMYYIFSEYAGGAFKNRKLERILPLPAGTYRLHYRSDERHSFDRWNNLPPDHYWWGIRLYDARGRQGAATGAFWQRARAPEELGWSSERLEALGPDLEALQTAALMIVTDGKVVFEWGRTANNIYSHSTRKSLLSALYGIYVEEGKIDPSSTLGRLGIEESVPLTEKERRATVRDLLKARSGVYIPAAAEARSMRDARPKRGSKEPGVHWYYNNWDFNVLGTIFRQQTGEDIYEAFKKRIGDALGLQDYFVKKQRYSYERNFSIHPAYPFLISARDMAKVGQLFLQKGRWGAVQVIPAGWVERSTRSYSDTGTSGLGYGYMWWVVTDETGGLKKGDYYASGYGGQRLFVIPRINTVIVHRVNIYLPGIDIWTAGRAPRRLLPRILQAYTGDRKQVEPVVAEAIKPARKLLADYVAIHAAYAAAEKENTVEMAAWSWLILSLGSLAVLMADLARNLRKLGALALVWVLIVIVFGPVGLAAYVLSYRYIHARDGLTASDVRFRLAIGVSLYSVAGYVTAMLLTVGYFVLVEPDARWQRIVPVGYFVPLLAGLLLFRAPCVPSGPQGGYLSIVRRTIIIEVISANLAFAGFGPVFIFLRFRFFPGSLGQAEMLSPVFWLMLSLGAIAGAFVLLPFNGWLARGNSGHLPTRSCGVVQAERASLSRALMLAGVLLSFLILAGSLALIISNLPQ